VLDKKTKKGTTRIRRERFLFARTKRERFLFARTKP
jgi:hypothetical protein